MPFKVIVIGGGLAGALLANGLLRHEVDFAVYDRLPQHCPRDGYDIRIGGPALEGMRACLDPDHLRRIINKTGRSGGRKSSAPVCYDRNFDMLLDLRVFPAYSKSAPIHRGTLRDALADPIYAAGKLHYEKTFSRFEIVPHASTGEERVKVFFEDGTIEECDLLIGADGSHSRVNRQLGLDNIRAVKTHVSFVTKGSLPNDEIDSLSNKATEAPVMTFADEKVLFFAAYLPDGDATPQTTDSVLDHKEDVVKTQKSHIEQLSTCMLAMQEPSATVPPEALTSWSNEEKWQFMSDSIRNWAPEYHQILELIRGEDVYVFRARAASRPPTDWRKKICNSERIWLIGDAIHAMLPARGQGGNQSMKDAAVLLPLILQLADLAKLNKHATSLQIAGACEKYENEMIPRTFAWVQKSGGDNLMPISSSTFFGKLAFMLAAQVLNVTWLYYTVKGWFTSETYLDDAPELAY